LPEPHADTVLLVRAGGRLCGLAVGSVVETMRPLPVALLAGAPAFVRGVAVVRGEPVPVVDLATLLGASEPGAIGRFVTVRAGSRPAALAVTSVLGVSRLDGGGRELPLVRDACAGALASLRTRDDELLVVLATARLVPEEALAALDRWEADA
jgi:purine-binding chemotaxis protein CheW